MTFDENRPVWEHARLRRDHARPQYGADDGSPEAIEAMAQEYVARARLERPWEFADDLEPVEPLDRRLHGWREEDRFEEALDAERPRGAA